MLGLGSTDCRVGTVVRQVLPLICFGLISYHSNYLTPKPLEESYSTSLLSYFMVLQSVAYKPTLNECRLFVKHLYLRELDCCCLITCMQGNCSPGKNLTGSWIGNCVPEVSSCLAITFGLPGRVTLELLNAAPRRLLSRVWGFELPWRSPHLTAEGAATTDRGTHQDCFHHLIKTQTSFCFWRSLRYRLPVRSFGRTIKEKKL